jgi:hypothetical protein
VHSQRPPIRPRPERARAAGRALATTLGACAAIALGGCSDTLQDRPIPHGQLEALIGQTFPVYWLGSSFDGYRITEASVDPGGAATVAYGDCAEGGQNTCVTPVRIVTSPDNSFVPLGAAAHTSEMLRGIEATIAEGGRAVLFASGRVVVAIYALHPDVAAAASETAVPIGEPGAPGAALTPRAPDTGYARKPLPVQLPTAPAPLGPSRTGPAAG